LIVTTCYVCVGIVQCDDVLFADATTSPKNISVLCCDEVRFRFIDGLFSCDYKWRMCWF